MLCHGGSFGGSYPMAALACVGWYDAVFHTIIARNAISPERRVRFLESLREVEAGIKLVLALQ